MTRIYLELFTLGFLFSIGPCLFLCGFAIFSYLLTTANGPAKNTANVILFCASKLAVYVLFGIASALFGKLALRSLARHREFMFVSAGIFVSLMGLIAIFAKEKIRPCIMASEYFLKKGYAAPVALGVILGILPCAPMVGALAYISFNAKTFSQGALCGFFFGLGGLFSPLLLAGLSTGFLNKFVEKKQKFVYILNMLGGVLLFFLGIHLAIKGF